MWKTPGMAPVLANEFEAGKLHGCVIAGKPMVLWRTED